MAVRARPAAASAAALVVVVAALLVAGADAATPQYRSGEWIAGRATFYGGTDQLVEAYKDRGIESFGIIEHGSCGYTLSDGTLAYPRDMYAALADTNWDYAGSCGRCYEVRCRPGLVQDRNAPVKTSQFYYLASVNNKYRDTYGRAFPGNAREKDGLQDVKCWSNSSSIVVKVGDSCPCQQKKPNGKVEPQFWCCGGANHMDLSYWAFEKLAHPVYGVIGVEYRPVDCNTKAPLNPVPGFVSPVIYSDDLGAGWGWRPYSCKNTAIRALGEGRGGSPATCLTASQDGAAVFVVRDGDRPGLQPFAAATRLDFWVKSNTKSDDPYASSTPPGGVPPLKVFLMNDEASLYCNKELYLDQLRPAGRDGDYFKFEIPLAAFQCGPGSSAGSLARINRVDFMNPNLRDADFCLDQMALVSGAVNAGLGGGSVVAEAAARGTAAAQPAAPAAVAQPAAVPAAVAQPAAPAAVAQPAVAQPAAVPARPVVAQPLPVARPVAAQPAGALGRTGLGGFFG